MRTIAALCVVALTAGLAVPAAFADTVVVPPGSTAPGDDPAHATPLEQVASRIASHIAGRTVAVRCWGDLFWNMLADVYGYDPDKTLGFVATRQDPETGLYTETATTAELAPATCAALETFAEASVKPTKCRPLVVSYVAKKVQQVVTRYRVVHKHGETKKVPYKVTVTKKVTQRVETPGPPAPCFVGGPAPPESGVCMGALCYSTATTDVAKGYWDAYCDFASAILTLAHEPIHLQQAQAGTAVPPDSIVETQAECSGLQWMAWVATQLGANGDDAQSVADYAWKVLYPSHASTDSADLPYWSAGCTPGGALDVRPAGSTAWP